jgi:leucyl aminopeptidase
VAAHLNVSATKQPPAAIEADTIALGLADGLPLASFAPPAVAELLARGEARTAFKSLALAHADGKRWLLIGLGDPALLEPERLRVAAAVVHERALEIGSRSLCYVVPGAAAAPSPRAAAAAATASELASAIVEGAILADYRFERFKSPGRDDERAAPKHLERLVIAVPAEDGAGAGDMPTAEGAATIDERALARSVEQARIIAEAVNATRELQDRPGNDLTPTALGEYARELASQLGAVSVATEGRDGILARSMGAFAAVAQGSEQEPCLITIRYEPPSDADASAAEPPVLGFVGKAITFDSGGISLKPGAKMSEMKYDMSGGAAVIGAIAAIARLRLPVRVIGVVGATENLPSGRSVKPGDIVTASNGATIEINNTDAEGRLVLADCLHHAISLGAQRLVDLATLTGAVVVALGSTYAGLMANDDELARRVSEAGERSGEIVWRLPMHDEYGELIRGRFADLDNAPEERKAGTIVAGTFLSNFVDQVPWAHLDIAGSAWDLGRAYAAKGAAGYGVRLLVELARSYCAG